ncbi:MAG: MFS transporter [Novosphingobium sp.]
MAQNKVQEEQPIGWGAKAIILAGGPAISLATSLIQAVLPSIQRDLAHGPDEAFLVKMLVGVNTLAMAIGAALTGFLVDRFGLKRVMTINYAVYAVAGTAGVYLNDLHLLLVSRFLLGLAAAGAVTGSIIIINARMGTQKRATWLGYYNAVAQAGSVVLNPVSGMLAEISWHWAFAIYGIAAPFAVLAFAALDGKAPKKVEQEHPAGPPLFSWFPFRFAFLGVCLGIIIYIPAVYLPFLLDNLGMKSPRTISIVLTGDIIAGSIAALLYGRARRVLSEYQAFSISVAFAGLGLFIAALAPNVVLVIIGSVVFGIGVAWFQPNLMFVLAGRVAPEQQGRAAGLVKSSVYLGSPVAVFLTEPVSRSYGATGAVLTVVLFSAALFVLALPKLARR